MLMLAAERASVVDLEHLNKYTGGDLAMNGEILRLFQKQATDMTMRLQDCMETGDNDGWSEAAHTLMGAARGIGAFALAETIAAAEKLQPGANRAKAQAALATIKSSAGLVHMFIDGYLR
jgi:HPt (histidine-containing phosphotransfer) domain-containing protein